MPVTEILIRNKSLGQRQPAHRLRFMYRTSCAIGLETSPCMSDQTPSKSLTEAELSVGDLPTRQRNALRLLLGKAAISAEEVARLDSRVIERAPGIGKNSLRIIRAWLNGQGYELPGSADGTISKRLVQRQRKLERAIDYLRENGYDVRRTD